MLIAEEVYCQEPEVLMNAPLRLGINGAAGDTKCGAAAAVPSLAA